MVLVGEFANNIDLGADGAGLAGVGDPDDVPARLAAADLARLVEVGDVDQHHVGVALHGRVLRVEDADQIELPVEGPVRLRVDLGGDRQLLADFPAVLVGEAAAGDHAGARVLERSRCAGGRELGTFEIERGDGREHGSVALL